jgi:hypothetical protein
MNAHEIRTKDGASTGTDRDRRRFMGAAALAFAATELGLSQIASAQTSSPSLQPNERGAHTSFGPLKQIKYRLCRGRATERLPRDPAARLALRHP